MVLGLFISVLVLTAGYLFVIGFHDAPNALAVAVRSRALTAKRAVTISAIFNFIGVLLSGFALIGYTAHWVSVPVGPTGLATLATSLLAAILWNLLTWWLRMPSSSTHALLGGLMGAVWAAGAVGLESGGNFAPSFWTTVALPLLVSPIVVFLMAWLLVFPCYALIRRAYPRTVNNISRNVLSLSNSAISLGHGIEVGQKISVLVVLAYASAQMRLSSGTLSIAFIGMGAILAAGTLLGGWRIGRTFAERMVRIDPFRGAIAQIVTAGVMLFGGLALNAPLSSSHVAASSVLGAGVNQRFSAVSTPIVRQVLWTWIFTVPASFCLAAIFFLALSPVL